MAKSGKNRTGDKGGKGGKKSSPDELPRGPLVEFSRTFKLQQLARGRSISISPSEAERAALAKRLNVPAVLSFQANMTVMSGSMRQGLQMEGSIAGEVVQVCTVSGKQFAAPVEASFKCMLLDDDPLAVAVGELNADSADEEVDCEYALDGYVELGELATQYFSLSVDPYPRAVGATVQTAVTPTVEEIAPNEWTEEDEDSWQAALDERERMEQAREDLDAMAASGEPASGGDPNKG